MVTNKLNDSRMSEMAKAQTNKSSKYVNLGTLSMFGEIEPNPGMELVSIAVRKNGVWDNNEYTRVLRLGLRPVNAKHYPHCKIPDDVYFPEGMRPRDDIIEVGGQVLMEGPKELIKQIRAGYHQKTIDAEASAKAAYVHKDEANSQIIFG